MYRDSSRICEENSANFGPLITEIYWWKSYSLKSTFLEDHISAPRSAAPPNFYTR